jgi:phosphoribosylformylglycinamidine (FGAM) synthase-like amidotransferase family enzyme
MIAVLQFPGLDAIDITMQALARAGMVPMLVTSQDASLPPLSDMHGFVILGGDTALAGHPLMQAVKTQALAGKPVLGIGGGAEMLLASGVVPGVEGELAVIRLEPNVAGCPSSDVSLRLSPLYQRNAFTRRISRVDVLSLLLTHTCDTFLIPPALLQEIREQGLDVFHYLGSTNRIAAIANKAGNALAMLPHPASTPEGDVIFQSMRDYIAKGKVEQVAPLFYYPR